jgi:hypothetical protein
MNWTITDRVKEEIENKYGIVCTVESSKTSDYIKLPTSCTSAGSIRISDHDAMTGRSDCALVSFTMADLNVEEWDGKWEANLEFDGLLEFGAEKPFDTMEAAENHNHWCMMQEIIRLIEKHDYLYDFVGK